MLSKPRTSPYSFQGLEEEGLKILYNVKQDLGMPVVTEVVDTRDVELVSRYSGHFADRRPEHAEFPPAQRMWKNKKAGALKKRAFINYRGVADGC